MTSNAFFQNQDSVFIEGLTVDAVIGVYDWERSITQPLVIDLVMYACQKSASANDDINQALDYKKICEQVIKTTQQCKANLIETVAEVIAQTLLAEFAIESIEVSVRKPTAIKETHTVGVKIIRHASS